MLGCLEAAFFENMFSSWSGNSLGVAMRPASGGASDAMVVSPTEITKAGRLEAAKRLVGRVIETETTDDMFSCYLLCGPTRKYSLHLEAWRELASVAKNLLPEGKLVSMSNVALALRKADKGKWSLSGCRMVIRFDKDLQVKVLDVPGDDVFVPGCDNLLLKDIPKATPTTSLEAAGCLREGTIAVRVFLLEIVQRPNAEQAEKSMCKLRVVEKRQQGPSYEADILYWGADARSRMSSMQVKCLYDICPLSVSVATDKHSFSLRWLRSTKAVCVEGADAYDDAVCAQPTVHLSQWKDKGLGRPDYKSQEATLIAASTLAHFVPERGCQKVSASDVWELPFVTVLDVVSSGENLPIYEGCSTCFRKSCSHGAPKRSCYNVEFSRLRPYSDD